MISFATHTIDDDIHADRRLASLILCDTLKRATVFLPARTQTGYMTKLRTLLTPVSSRTSGKSVYSKKKIINKTALHKIRDKTSTEEMECFYKAQYSVLRTSQSILHFTPWYTCSPNISVQTTTISNVLNYSGQHLVITMLRQPIHKHPP